MYTKTFQLFVLGHASCCFVNATPIPAIAVGAVTGGIGAAVLIPIALDAAAVAGTAGAAAAAGGAAGAAGVAASGLAAGVATATGLTGAAVGAGVAGSVTTGVGAGVIGAAAVAPAVVGAAAVPAAGAVAFGGVCLAMSLIGHDGYDMKCWKQIVDPSTLSQSDLEDFEINGLPVSVARNECDLIIDGHGMATFRTKNDERFLIAVADQSGKHALLHVSPFVPQKLIKDVEE